MKNSAYSISKSNTQTQVWALVPAAGVGQRMGAKLPKQYLSVGGKTVLEHTLDLLNHSPKIKRTMLCTAPDDTKWSTLSVDVLHANGGATRAQSVLNGLEALNSMAANNDWILVHDAARPCLSPRQLNTFIDQLYEDEIGGLLAMPCKDTLKLAKTKQNTPAEVDCTLDRDQVWQAQTPQMFRYEPLLNALSNAVENNVEITDEASAMEYAGLSPRLVAGDARNIKITTPEDLGLATFLLDQQGRLQSS